MDYIIKERQLLDNKYISNCLFLLLENLELIIKALGKGGT